MADRKRLVASIVQFLGDQLSASDLSGDQKESLEVAIQCLESSYDVSSSDAHLLSSRKLEDIFKEGTRDEQWKEEATPAASDEEKAEAERLKNEGNNLMKMEKFDEALKCYTRSIQIDGRNAVYYCNRAAAYSKLNNHTFALEDCRKAIEIDSNYSKAYGRMGLAYASLNDHYRARDCYKKAGDLDPANDSYKNNLSIAEEKVREAERTNPFAGLGMGGSASPFGGMDIGAMLNNPALMQMASNLMQDPNMQNLIGNVMGSLAGAGVPPPAAAASTPPTGSAPSDGDGSSSSDPSAAAGAPPLDAFLQAGRMFAEQMSQANPELIERLRSQVPGSGASAPPSTDDKKEEEKK